MIICNLKRILNKKKIHKTRLSVATGIDRTQIYKFLDNNIKGYRIKTVSKLCDYLGINADELLTFTSCNLKFKIIPKYSRTVASDNNGSFWIHLVLNAINPHYYVNNPEHSAKSIGYFNFDAEIRAYRDKLLVGYQFSQSIPLFKLELDNDNFRPIERDYLRSIADNKHNLVNCVLLAISLHNNEIIKTVFPGTILNGTITYYPNGKKKTYHYKNTVTVIPAKITILPALEMLNKITPAKDLNELIVKAQDLPNLYGTANLDNSDPGNDSINYSNTEREWRFLPARPNDKRDMAIFGLFNHDQNGGNGINHVTNDPYKFSYYYHQRYKNLSNKWDALNNKLSSLKRKLKRIDKHNDKINKIKKAKLNKAVKDINKESSERAKKLLTKHHLNHK